MLTEVFLYYTLDSEAGEATILPSLKDAIEHHKALQKADDCPDCFDEDNAEASIARGCICNLKWNNPYPGEWRTDGGQGYYFIQKKKITRVG